MFDSLLGETNVVWHVCIKYIKRLTILWNAFVRFSLKPTFLIESKANLLWNFYRIRRVLHDTNYILNYSHLFFAFRAIKIRARKVLSKN